MLAGGLVASAESRGMLDVSAGSNILLRSSIDNGEVWGTVDEDKPGKFSKEIDLLDVGVRISLLGEEAGDSGGSTVGSEVSAVSRSVDGGGSADAS